MPATPARIIVMDSREPKPGNSGSIKVSPGASPGAPRCRRYSAPCTVPHDERPSPWVSRRKSQWLLQKTRRDCLHHADPSGWRGGVAVTYYSALCMQVIQICVRKFDSNPASFLNTYTDLAMLVNMLAGRIETEGKQSSATL